MTKQLSKLKVIIRQKKGFLDKKVLRRGFMRVNCGSQDTIYSKGGTKKLIEVTFHIMYQERDRFTA